MILYYKFRAFLLTWMFRLMARNIPLVLQGAGSSTLLCKHVSLLGYSSVIIVTDKFLNDSGILDGIKAALKDHGVSFCIFDAVLPDPSFDQVQQAQKMAQAENVQAVVAVGGGSVLDAAKMMAMLHTNPGELSDYNRPFTMKNVGLPLFAVPTTAGTGAEITPVAVITDPDTHNKVPVLDGKMIPGYIALDADIMRGLPPGITAATGMDALTHAVESFVATSSYHGSEDQARAAVRLIFKFLFRAWENGDDADAREGMALAAFYAGSAFSKTSVGYVHGIAHQLGRLCGTPHGNANAMLLPEVLSAYGDCVYPRLAELAVVAGIADPDSGEKQRALAFIQAIINLRKQMDMPLEPRGLSMTSIDEVLKEVIKETGELYPVPRYLSREELRALVVPLVKGSS
jgi:alcohol dehydrogenase